MKRIISSIIAMACLAAALSGCSENERARAFGGTITHAIPAGEQLVSMTWKDAQLWVLTYNPKTKQCFYRESSAHGFMEGTVLVENCELARSPEVAPAAAGPESPAK